MEYKQIYNKSRKINVYSNLEGLHEEIIEYYLFLTGIELRRNYILFWKKPIEWHNFELIIKIPPGCKLLNKEIFFTAIERESVKLIEETIKDIILETKIYLLNNVKGENIYPDLKIRTE